MGLGKNRTKEMGEERQKQTVKGKQRVCRAFLIVMYIYGQLV